MPTSAHYRLPVTAMGGNIGGAVLVTIETADAGSSAGW
jgi:hypothetical protein